MTNTSVCDIHQARGWIAYAATKMARLRESHHRHYSRECGSHENGNQRIAGPHCYRGRSANYGDHLRAEGYKFCWPIPYDGPPAVCLDFDSPPGTLDWLAGIGNSRMPMRFNHQAKIHTQCQRAASAHQVFAMNMFSRGQFYYNIKQTTRCEPSIA